MRSQLSDVIKALEDNGRYSEMEELIAKAEDALYQVGAGKELEQYFDVKPRSIVRKGA